MLKVQSVFLTLNFEKKGYIELWRPLCRLICSSIYIKAGNIGNFIRHTSLKLNFNYINVGGPPLSKPVYAYMFLSRFTLKLVWWGLKLFSSCRSSHQRCSVKKVFCKFLKISGNFIKKACNFIKIKTLTQVFSYEFY